MKNQPCSVKNRLRKLITNFTLFLAIFLLPLDGARLNFNFSKLFKQFKVIIFSMELAEWLVHWAPELAS